MKWVVKHFIPLGGNPHRQMDLYPPLGGRKPAAVALIIPPGVDYAIAPDEGSLWFEGIAEPNEVACVAIHPNCCGMKPQSISRRRH